jgi:dipeptidase D
VSELKPQFKWQDAEFETVLSFFEDISQVPRPSKHEKEIASYIENFGKKNGLKTKRDDFDNVVLFVPASPGFENKPPVVLQSHMDMVCEKEPDSPHNFLTDGLELKYVFENNVPFLTADKTTLGADNGIGMAYALATAVSSFNHPPLELLFTTDEEEGFTGAQNMSEDFITGKYLINLDSEEEGVLIIGCAGGAQIRFKSFIETVEDNNYAASDSNVYHLTVFGLLGGHSGTDIHLNRGNAIQIACLFLKDLAKQDASFQLAEIRGGTAHNAIPRDCACLFISHLPEDVILKEAAEFVSQMKARHFEESLQLTVSILDEKMPSFSSKNTADVIRFLTELQIGVFEMSPFIKDIVLLSGNLAIVQTAGPCAVDCKEAACGEEKAHKLEMIYSLRCGDGPLLLGKMKELIDFGEKNGFHAEISNKYPPWSPDIDSPFLEKCFDVYQSVFQEKAKITVIHAGLECSVFSRKIPGIEMVSIGPDIINAHSPSEKLNLIAAEKVWIYLKDILESF